MKTRGFEVLSSYQDQDIKLPQRQTHASAGYDLAAAADVTVPSIWQLNLVRLFRMIRNGHQLYEPDYRKANQAVKPTLIPTGLKAYMPDDEVLIIANRSSNTFRHHFTLPNGIGVVDADYYNNASNEGSVGVQVINYGVCPLHIKKGERIAQGIFMKYLRTDQDEPVDRERLSGFGSTNKA
ncbi:MAG: dUTP diphosphatase [Lactobacillus sp.]